MNLLATSRLRAASKNGDPIGILAALDKSGDPLAFATHGVSALSMAIEGGHDECVAVLLSRCDKAELAQTHGFALFLAAASGQLTPFKLLARHFNPKARTSTGATALSVAAANGQAHCLQYLADVGEPSYCGPSGTALHAAARHGKAECVPFLLTVCDPAARDEYELTALQIAAEQAHPETLRAFVADAQPSADSEEHDDAFARSLASLRAARAERLAEQPASGPESMGEAEIEAIECLSILAPLVSSPLLSQGVQAIDAELSPAAAAPLRAVSSGEQAIAPLSEDLARRRDNLRAQKEAERARLAPKQPASRL